MRSIFAVITAALVGQAVAKVNLAQPAEEVNATHFKDPATGKAYVHFDCSVANEAATKDLKAVLKDLHRRELSGSIFSRSARDVFFRQNNPISINAYFHLITKKANAGSITSAMATGQLKALNDMYGKYGITFKLAGTDTTVNDAWAVASGSDMDALKKALRKGKYSDLNLYFHTDLDGGILGTCTMPSTLPKNAQQSVYWSDGCNIASGTMPGGSIYGYSQGMTAVHETGHWLGLLHTFEGYACSGDGDFISDTKVQSTSTDGCPDNPAKNSCPSVAGVDPIHNIMDYSTDACYTGFTPLQVQRIQTLWTQFRSGK